MKKVMLGILSLVLLGSVLTAQPTKEVDQVRKKLVKFKKDHPRLIVKSQSSLSVSGQDMDSESKTYYNGDKIRVDVQILVAQMPEPLEINLISNNGEIWLNNPFQGLQKIEKDNPMARSVKDQYSHLPEDAKFVKAEKIGDYPCYQFTFSVGDQEGKVWFNSKNGAYVQGENPSPQGNMVAVVKKYIKLKNGDMYPSEMEITMDNKKVGNVTVSSIEEPESLSDDLFDYTKL